MSVVEAIALAVIEGLTEFLPISSTGHMIIASSAMGIATDPFTKLFTIAIQLGAILSVVVLYYKNFARSFEFYYKLLVAFIPAAVLGFLLNDWIDSLLERVDVVAYSLLVGGVFFLFVDKIFSPAAADAGDKPLPYRVALKIGMFQTLALVPGVSRSAATIIGGLTQKLDRKAAAEFSFFLAVPTMLAATGYKLLRYFIDGESWTSAELTLLMVGNAVAFVVAILAIRAFVSYLTRYGFRIFGYYRIVLGIVILVLYYLDIGLTVI
jgi:undecaprenyl-diphosphatase